VSVDEIAASDHRRKSSIGVGDAEQLRDHQHGEGRGNPVDEVDGFALRGVALDLVEDAARRGTHRALER
jgi:hypothetical protein